MADDALVKTDINPQFLKPTLRIFFSVDIVNSTAFKQSQRYQSDKSEIKSEKIGQPWFSPITEFYHGIENRFRTKWTKFAPKNDAGEAPELWKAAGDELIYTKVLTNHRQALAGVVAWIETVEGHRKDLKDKFPSLDLKASAWIAGFPVNNAEVILRRSFEDDDADVNQVTDGDAVLLNLLLLEKFYQYSEKRPQNLIRDFIGPSMDTGFRICGLATPRKFAITADLAYMLANASNPDALDGELKQYRELKFRYDGRVPLKGVDGGEPYPFFWIDMKSHEQLFRSEDDLLPKADIQPHNIEAFCSNYFKAHDKQGGHIMVPYIEDANEAPFNFVPDAHRELLDGLSKKLSSYKNRAAEAPVIELDSATSTGEFTKQSGDLDQDMETRVLSALPVNLFRQKATQD